MYFTLRSLKELDAEFLLELSDLLAQGRLTDVQAYCGAAEVQFLSYGDKVPKVA
jgi:hypothetical protein